MTNADEQNRHLSVEVEVLRAQLAEARRGLVAARAFVMSPTKWTTRYSLPLGRDLDFAIAVSEPADIIGDAAVAGTLAALASRVAE